MSEAVQTRIPAAVRAKLATKARRQAARDAKETAHHNRIVSGAVPIEEIFESNIAPNQVRIPEGSTLFGEMVAFFESLRVPEGPLIGKPWVLLPYQIEAIRAICDPKIRRIIISIPRKGGKSAFAAALVLAAVVGPISRLNSSLFSAARSRDQAALVYGLAVKIANLTPWLRNEIKYTDSRKAIKGSRYNTEYRALSADAQRAHGLSPSLVIHDELGQVKGPSDELYDALETAFGAQAAPKSIIISTQAAEDDDLLSTLIDDAISSSDPHTRVIFYGATRDDDPWSEATWKKAHPAYGLFRNPVEFRQEAERAKRLPSAELAFRRYYLNQRITGDTGFVTPTVWKANAGAVRMEAFTDGRPVFGALDLSARQDLTALVLVCEDDDGSINVLTNAWSPDETLHARSVRDRAPYTTWRDKGVLRTTPGSSISYGHVIADMQSITAGMNLASIAFDRWRIAEFRREQERLGIEFPLNECGQGYRDMSPRIEATMSELVDKKLRHGGHPVLTMAVSAAEVVRDPAGNAKLDKGKTYGRIDPAVAMVMAIGEMRRSTSASAGAAMPFLVL
jgi:phage terminase large subunit-like protein